MITIWRIIFLKLLYWTRGGSSLKTIGLMLVKLSKHKLDTRLRQSSFFRTWRNIVKYCFCMVRRHTCRSFAHDTLGADSAKRKILPQTVWVKLNRNSIKWKKTAWKAPRGSEADFMMSLTKTTRDARALTVFRHPATSRLMVSQTTY